MLAERRTWKFTLNGCDAKNLFLPQMAKNCGMTEWFSFQVSTFANQSKARLRFLAKINRVLNEFSVDSWDPYRTIANIGTANILIFIAVH